MAVDPENGEDSNHLPDYSSSTEFPPLCKSTLDSQEKKKTKLPRWFRKRGQPKNKNKRKLLPSTFDVLADKSYEDISSNIKICPKFTVNDVSALRQSTKSRKHEKLDKFRGCPTTANSRTTTNRSSDSSLSWPYTQQYYEVWVRYQCWYLGWSKFCWFFYFPL